MAHAAQFLRVHGLFRKHRDPSATGDSFCTSEWNHRMTCSGVSVMYVSNVLTFFQPVPPSNPQSTGCIPIAGPSCGTQPNSDLPALTSPSAAVPDYLGPSPFRPLVLAGRPSRQPALGVGHRPAGAPQPQRGGGRCRTGEPDHAPRPGRVDHGDHRGIG